jgi:hypothetical protein
MKPTFHQYEAQLGIYRELQVTSSSHSGTCWQFGMAIQGKVMQTMAWKGKVVEISDDL